MWNKHFIASLLSQILLALSLIFLIILASWPIPTHGHGLPWDKLHHAAAFIYLSLLARYALTHRSNLHLSIVLMIYGGLMEIIQGFTGYRDASLGDFFADWVGIAIGINFPLCSRLHKLCSHKSTPVISSKHNQV